MYPRGTFVPAGSNDRSEKHQAALDEYIQEFLAQKKAEELEKYEAAYAAFQAEGGGLENLDMFILAFPSL